MPRDEQQPPARLPATSVPSERQHHSVISAEKLKQLYTLMVRLRTCEGRPHPKKRTGRGPHFGVACEAAAVIELRSGDAVAIVSGQPVALLARGPGAANGKGEEARAGAWSLLEEGGRDRLAMAAGAAFAHRSRQSHNVVIAFAQSGEIARASDSVGFAERERLPVVYFEMAAVSVPRSKPTAHGLATIPVDDSDAVAVYRVAYEAIAKARRGAGPTLIRCIRLRSLPASIRFMDQRGDPIAYLEHYLRKQNLWSEDLHC